MSKSVQQVTGVLSADVNFATGLLRIEYDRTDDPRKRVVAVVVGAGHGMEAMDAADSQGLPPVSWWTRNRTEVSVAVSAALLVVGWLLGWSGAETAGVGAHALAIIVGGSLVWRRAAVSLMARSLDMNVLMTLAVSGAAALGEWGEGATVIVLFALGGMLEARSVARTRREISGLMALAPSRARVRRDGAEIEVVPEEVTIGELVVVRPGERVPLDGLISEGRSVFDESPITGESVPADRGPGDAVYAGTLNTFGLVVIATTTEANDTTIARIVHLVESARASRAPVQRFVDRFSRIYTPVVVAIAVAIAVGGPLLGELGAGVQGFVAWREWVYRSLTLLVISCPCALVVSTPVAVVSGITRATREGILVKGGVFLERAVGIQVVAFDKTGTLTEGRPEVAEVVPFAGYTAENVLQLAAAVEAHSNHPLASAVTEAAGGVRCDATEVYEEPGRGVSGVVGSERVSVGSVRYAGEQGVDVAQVGDAVARLEAQGHTTLVVFVYDASLSRVLGVIGVADAMRLEATSAVATLAHGGVQHVAMLTGDSPQAAARVAEVTGITEVRSRLLPQDKTGAVEELRGRFGAVLLVGDGINDAPALATADIGVAMGAAGSPIAIETADVALMSDDLGGVPRFLELGRRTMRIIRQNIAASIAVKIVFIALAVVGRATLWMAVFADTGIALLVIANSLRLLGARDSHRQE
ncbi:MAG: cation-translocating P-type ATPase [Coriobacteriia bacterium]|nr:cation-translocating P-type ATPase [Coriobacteriia bacterium]